MLLESDECYTLESVFNVQTDTALLKRICLRPQRFAQKAALLLGIGRRIAHAELPGRRARRAHLRTRDCNVQHAPKPRRRFGHLRRAERAQPQAKWEAKWAEGTREREGEEERR